MGGSLEQRVSTAALLMAAALAAGGFTAGLIYPLAFADRETSEEFGLFFGATTGLAGFLAIYPAPQLLFGLALRWRDPWNLAMTIPASAFMVVLYVLPFADTGAGDLAWDRTPLFPVGVATAILDVFVLLAASRAWRRLHSRRSTEADA